VAPSQLHHNSWGLAPKESCEGEPTTIIDFIPSTQLFVPSPSANH